MTAKPKPPTVAGQLDDLLMDEGIFFLGETRPDLAAEELARIAREEGARDRERYAMLVNGGHI